MKVDSGSPFQKLAAGKLGDERAPQPRQEQLPQVQLEKAVKVNVDAASAISRVASSDGSTGDGPSAQVRNEVVQSLKAASETRPEDVSNLADLLASRIRKAPEEAIRAHKDPNVQKIHQLLQ